MDDAALDVAHHRTALRGLARINALSQVDRPVWRKLVALASTLKRPLRVLDVATGSGDLLIRIAARAQRAGLSLDLHACDISDVALAEAQAAASVRGVSITTHRLNVLVDSLPGGFDLAHCALFLHHLDPPQVEVVLANMAGAASAVLVQDLRRTRLGLGLAWVVPRLLTTSRVVHIDAVRSVHAAYTIEEMSDMARRAGLDDARIARCWPERMVLSWDEESTR